MAPNPALGSAQPSHPSDARPDPAPTFDEGFPCAPDNLDALAAPELFPLDRSYTFLNHGSFGSVPHEVAACARRWREEIEARPIEMLDRRLDGLLREAVREVARFVGSTPARTGFVVNATEGVHAFLRSIRWNEGDEVIVLDQVYNAMRQQLLRLVEEEGIVVREIALPWPVESEDAIVGLVEAAVGARTRLAIIDHVTSPTAVVMPVGRIVAGLRARGIVVLVDGAHAPGSIALEVDAIGADAYVANLHKWTCAPKGCAFLAVGRGWEERVRPLATSHRFREGFAREFDWQGTRDPSPWLTAPAAIAFFERFGWPRVRARNHAMAVWSQRLLAESWGVATLTPRDGSMLASMAPVAVPERVRARFPSARALQAALYGRHRIEIPVIEWRDRWHVRVSCHLHVREADVLVLRDALPDARP
jgi:isopenicillin-N epimerase